MTIAGTGTDVYCGAIYELAEDDIDTAQVQIANRLGVSRAAVSEMVKRLRDEGLVTVEAGRLQLTRAGRAVAERTVRRHRLAERFLVDVLDLGWADAHHEAARWQHVLDDHTEVALQRMLGDPATCPHGNPLPGVQQVHTDAVRLTDLHVGAIARVVRIAERLEVLDGMLEALERGGVVPGAQISIMSIGPTGDVTMRGPRRTLQLPGPAVMDLFVVEGDLAAISETITGRTASLARTSDEEEQ